MVREAIHNGSSHPHLLLLTGCLLREQQTPAEGSHCLPQPTQQHRSLLCRKPLSPSPCTPPVVVFLLQYSRDFYLGQWLRDTQVELEKAMKETGEDMDSLTAENNGDIPVISSSAVALQQAELKKDILHSLIGPKSQSEIKSVHTLPTLLQ